MRFWSMAAALALAAGTAWAAPAPAGPGPGGPMGPGAGPCPMMGPDGCPMMRGGGGPGMMGGRPGMMGGHGGPMAHSLPAILLAHQQMLNLTDAQADRLRTLNLEVIKQAITPMANMALSYINILQMAEQPNPDRNKIDAAIRDLGKQANDLVVAEGRLALDSWLVLTPEQRQTITRMMGPGGMMGGMMGGGMMGGGMMGGGMMGGGMPGGPMPGGPMPGEPGSAPGGAPPAPQP